MLEQPLDLDFGEFQVLGEDGRERGQNLVDHPIQAQVFEFLALNEEQVSQDPHVFDGARFERQPLIPHAHERDVGNAPFTGAPLVFPRNSQETLRHLEEGFDSPAFAIDP